MDEEWQANEGAGIHCGAGSSGERESRAAFRVLLRMLLCICAASSISCRKSPPPSPPPITFYGHVEDQDGNPVAGAQVVVKTTHYADSLTMPGSVTPSNEDAKTTTVTTGPQGDFSVVIPDADNCTLIEAVRKPGYERVIDWAWTAGNPGGNIQVFNFPGSDVPLPIYSPDPKRPAIFPLHLKGSNKPVHYPSRGGTDHDKDGIRINVPKPPNVPSTGPGAPRTPQEIDAAIRAHYDKINARKGP